MVVEIGKIKIQNRIRKDLGDIKELADDIAANGLINPPVVNKDFVLLAGERRLTACKSLGWNQIEVRMMDTRDAEHELNVEISENDVRKGFTKSERVDYMKRLLRIEQAKAKERMSEGGKGVENATALKRSDEATAKQFEVSAKTMRREIAISDNRELLDPSDFTEWDEGRLSTNKAYQKLKQKEADREKENASLRQENAELKTALEEEKLETRVERVEVLPEDYESLKEAAKKLKHVEADYKREWDNANEKQKRILALQDELAELKRSTKAGLDESNLSENIFYFCMVCNNFIGNVGGLVWLTDRIADMPEKEKSMFLKAANSFVDWSLVFKENLERSMNEKRTDTRVPLQLDTKS